MTFETALPQWEDGLRRLESAPARERAILEDVAGKIFDGLRRRLGGAFTVSELADLYDQGIDWTVDVAIATAPEHPEAWDVRTVADAAFARYVRQASDYAGGRRRIA